MAIFVVLQPHLLTTKLRCLQKNNFGHTILPTYCSPYFISLCKKQRCCKCFMLLFHPQNVNRYIISMTNIARFLPFMDCVEKAFFFHGLFAHECFICLLKNLGFYCKYCICKVSFFNIISRIQILFFVAFFSFIGFFLLFPYFALMIISTSVDLSEKSTRKKCSTQIYSPQLNQSEQ